MRGVRAERSYSCCKGDSDEEEAHQYDQRDQQPGKASFSPLLRGNRFRATDQISEAIIRTANERKVYLILDNLRVHHSKKLQSWLKSIGIKPGCFICHHIRPNTILTNISTMFSNEICVHWQWSRMFSS